MGSQSMCPQRGRGRPGLGGLGWDSKGDHGVGGRAAEGPERAPAFRPQVKPEGGLLPAAWSGDHVEGASAPVVPMLTRLCTAPSMRKRCFCVSTTSRSK